MVYAVQCTLYSYILLHTCSLLSLVAGQRGGWCFLMQDWVLAVAYLCLQIVVGLGGFHCCRYTIGHFCGRGVLYI